MRFLILIILLSIPLTGCREEIDHKADLSQISERDAQLYCLAREEWGYECEDDGVNQVLYDENLRTDGWISVRNSGSWTMWLRPNTPCMYKIIRHEIGHVLGYSHGEHEWVQAFTLC